MNTLIFFLKNIWEAVLGLALIFVGMTLLRNYSWCSSYYFGNHLSGYFGGLLLLVGGIGLVVDSFAKASAENKKKIGYAVVVYFLILLTRITINTTAIAYNGIPIDGDVSITQR